MRFVLFTLAFLVNLFLMAQPQVDERLTLLNVFELQHVSDPQINETGDRIAYVRNFKDIMHDKNLSNIWVIDYDGSNHLPIASGDYQAHSPRWSPDGKRLAFISNQGGTPQIYLHQFKPGYTLQLSRLMQEPSGLQWSPDGRYLAFAMKVMDKVTGIMPLPPKPEGATWAAEPIYIDKLRYRADGQGYLLPGYRHLFLIDTGTGHVRQITDRPFDHSEDFTWTNDGKFIIFSANRHSNREQEPNDSELYRLNLSSGEVKALTNRKGPDQSPRVSPSGRFIAFLGYDEKYLGYQPLKPYLLDTEKGKIKEMDTQLDRNFENIQWSAEEDGIFFQYDNLGDTKLAFLGIDGSLKEILRGIGGLSLGRPYSGGTYTIAKNGQIAFTLTSPYHPAELGIGQKSGGGVGRLTQLNQGLFAHKKLGEVEEIWYESSFDGRRIQGWVVKPPGYDPEKQYPMILEIHGGPFLNYGARFSAELQLYAAAGYVVLYTNPRGSTSYGSKFGNLIHHNYPGEDYFDLISGVQAVVEKGYVDPNNLFITGGSGGGVLTAWAIGQTDLFSAAVVAKPVINWTSFVLYADDPAYFYKYWFRGYPWKYPEEYQKRSPLSLVGNVRTPTMLLTGEQDHRTPIAESEQYYTALKLQGVDAALVRMPEASHGISERPSQLVAKVAYILAWFEKYRTQ